MRTKRFGKQYAYTLLLLTPYFFMFAIAQDVYLPSIPHVKQAFQVSQSTAQLTLSLFMLAVGLGQLLLGPWSDRIGRKPLLLLALLSFGLGSAGCLLAPSIYIFIAARLFQAFGACAMMVAALAILRDLYQGNRLTKSISFVNASIGLSPIFMPAIGAYLDMHYGWHSIFYFLLIVSVVITLITMSLVRETHSPSKQRSQEADLFSGFKTVIRSRQFWVCAYTGAAGLACFFTFVSMSPYIILNVLHYSEKDFGYFFIVVGSMFMAGSIVNGYLVKRFGTYRMAVFGMSMSLLSGIALFCLSILFKANLLIVMGPMLVLSFATAMAMGAGAGGAIQPFGDYAGTASALYASSKFLLAFFVSSIAMMRDIQTLTPLAVTILVLTGSSLLFCKLTSH